MRKTIKIAVAAVFLLSMALGASTGAIAVEDNPATCDAEGQGDGGTDLAEESGGDSQVDSADDNCRDTPEGEVGNSDQ